MTKTSGTKNHAQMAGILCNDTRFQAFVANRTCQASATADDAASFLRNWCSIASRRDLNTDPFAQTKFATLRTEFDAWTGRIGTPR